MVNYMIKANHLTYNAYVESRDISMAYKIQIFIDYRCENHGFQNRTEPGGRTVKTGNRDENRFLSLKNWIFC